MDGSAKQPLILGLDLGANSIGWWLWRARHDEDGGLSPTLPLAGGVRIVNPGSPAERRAAVQQRRQRDRRIRRFAHTASTLKGAGLLPADEAAWQDMLKVDPWACRALALSCPLASPYLVGRALMHLSKRRGFQGSRADTEKKDAKETAFNQLRTSFVAGLGGRALGQFFHERVVARRASPEGRLMPVRRPDVLGDYRPLFTRAVVESEFNAIWDAQAPHFPDQMTQKAKASIHNAIFFQRRLRPVFPGGCALIPGELRAPVASPMFERFRALAAANNLRFDGKQPEPLDRASRDAVVERLLFSADTVSIAGIRAAIARARGVKKTALPPLTIEREEGRQLKGSPATARLSKALPDLWPVLSRELREALVLLLVRTDTDDRLRVALRSLPTVGQDVHDACRCAPQDRDLLARLGELPRPLSESEIEALVAVTIPAGYGHYGRAAIGLILPQMEAEVVPVNVAVEGAGLAPRLNASGGHRRLPYYGEIIRMGLMPSPRPHRGGVLAEGEAKFGRIGNTTVHVTLNQLRLVVNRLIERYGRPARIVVEAARDFGLGEKGLQELNLEIRQNTEFNKRIDSALAVLGVAPSQKSRRKLRLFLKQRLGLPIRAAERRRAIQLFNPERIMELRSTCLYTGAEIHPSMLFSTKGSDTYVDVDHIIPRAESLDDGESNLALVVRAANRKKAKDLLWRAFPDQVEQIVARAKAMHLSRATIERLQLTEIPEQGFLSRHLNDTRYATRLAAQYVGAVCQDVIVINGKMTAWLRDALGLRKDRSDLRHHAIDAGVAGLIQRRTVQGLAHAVKAMESATPERRQERLNTEIAKALASLGPLPEIEHQIHRIRDRILVSHPPSHDISGPLHRATHYRAHAEIGAGPVTATERVDVTKLEMEDLARIAVGPADQETAMFKEAVVAMARDLQEEAIATVMKKSAIKAAFAQRVRDVVRKLHTSRGFTIKRVRLAKTLTLVPVGHQKATAAIPRLVETNGNHCALVWVRPDGEWKVQVISRLEAARTRRASADPAPPVGLEGSSILMRFHIDDYVSIETPDGRVVRRVRKMSGETVFLSNPQDTAEGHSEGFSGRKLRLAGALAVNVDPIGFVVPRRNLS